MRGWAVLIGTFVVGIALGVLGTLRLPSLAEPYLPSALSARPVDAQVTKKLREPNRLLLRLQVDRALVLATFTKKVPEVDLLVQEGDTLTADLPRNRPFVEDPVIQMVRHPTPVAAGHPPER